MEILLLWFVMIKSEQNKFYLKCGILFLMFALKQCLRQPSPMCRSGNEPEDCSFQLPYLEENSCQIYNSTVCLRHASIYSNLGIDLQSESMASFSVQVHPYSAQFPGSPSQLAFSAINMTFTIFPKSGIDSFSVIIKEDRLNKSFCRLFDFKNYSRDITVSTDLYYDCFYNLVEYNIQNVTMTFISYPVNQELNYYVSIPSAISRSLSCNFTALIMVFCGSLSKGIIQMKFSVPPELNITSYIVELIHQNTYRTVFSILKNSHLSTNMIPVTFPSVKEDFYYISIKPENRNATICSPAKTAPFYVSSHSFGFLGRVLLLVVVVFLLLILSLFIILKCLHTYVKTEILPKQALLVYSYDCPEHEAFITSFSTYLYNSCKINSCTIYGKIEDKEKWIRSNTALTTKDPLQWLRDRYQESDAVIYVISEGLDITLSGEGDTYVKEGTPWRKQVSSIYAYISTQIFNLSKAQPKKFCKISFPHSDKVPIPPCLSDFGPHFKLPKDTNKFFCFLQDCQPLLPFTNIYPKLLGSCPPEYEKEMLQKLGDMQSALDNQRHVIKITKSGYVGVPSESCAVETLNDFTAVENKYASEESDLEKISIDSSIFFPEGWKENLQREYQDSKTANLSNCILFTLEDEFK